MKFRNPFKRRKTAAEIIDTARRIMSEHGITEAYYSYDFMQDPETDKPKCVDTTFIVTYPSSAKQRLALIEDLVDALGDYIYPHPAFIGTDQLAYTRKYHVPLFA